jgi:hypothetical protein
MSFLPMGGLDWGITPADAFLAFGFVAYFAARLVARRWR